MQRLEGITSLLLAALLWMTGQACATPAMTPPADAAAQAQVASSYGKLPLSFEINRGQTFTVTQAGAVPACTLTASPSTITAGQSSTLTARCSPAATSYAWTNTGFAATASSGSVSPRVTTTYSVIGSNAAGSGNMASATVTATINSSTPLPPPPTAQSVFTAPTGTMPAAAVSVSPSGTFGNATLVVTLDLSKVLSGDSFAGLGQFAAGYNSEFAAGYNIYVAALVPSGALGLPSATWFMLSATHTWAALSVPIAAFLEGLAQDATNSVVIFILQDLDITALVGTEFYIGYGTSDTEMLQAQRYRGIYTAN